jgi:hypothetical protein
LAKQIDPIVKIVDFGAKQRSFKQQEKRQQVATYRFMGRIFRLPQDENPYK